MQFVPAWGRFLVQRNDVNLVLPCEALYEP